MGEGEAELEDPEEDQQEDRQEDRVLDEGLAALVRRRSDGAHRTGSIRIALDLTIV